MSECRQLIWDYERGDVICLDTGEVVDRILDVAPPLYQESRVQERLRISVKVFRKYRSPIPPSYPEDLELYRRAKRFEERGYIVDYDKLFSQRRFVETVYSLESYEAIQKLQGLSLKHFL